LVLWDVDWETLSMSGEPQRTRRVLDAWDTHLVHRSLPRALTSGLRKAGFAEIGMTGHSFVTNELTPQAYGGSLVAIVLKYLRDLDDFPDDDAQAWADEQTELGEKGEFYSACVQCCVTAVRA
jgi:hypothetical protein